MAKKKENIVIEKELEEREKKLLWLKVSMIS